MTTPHDLAVDTTTAGATRSVAVDLPAPTPRFPGADAWCRVRVHGPDGAVDVTLPTGRTVADLVGELTTSLLPGAPWPGATSWHLHRLGRPALDPEAPLARALPVEGEVLHLSAGVVPAPAERVDDALDALASGTAGAGRWTASALAVVVGAGAVAASATLATVLLVARPGAALPLLLAAALLTTALVLRRDGALDLGAGVAAAAALPAWVAAGVAVAGSGLGGVGVTAAAAAGLALALGSAAAAAAVPLLAPWWALTGTSGALVALGGALVASGLVASGPAAALVGTVVLLGMAALPWAVTRSSRWSSPAPGSDPQGLAGRGVRARSTLTAVSVAAALAVGVCVVVLGTGDDLLQRWLAAALAVVMALRARRSRFALESGAMLVAGLGPLAVVLVAVAASAGGDARWGVVVALVALLAGLLAVLAAVRRATAGETATLERMNRAKVRRTLGVLEGLVAVAVVPLLAGAMGLYEAAGNAGSQL